jgi:tetratricopeptide (TPR) repeat protein
MSSRGVNMNQTCFVVMGFGKKTDYQSGRVLDLDKSYRYIIKPAAERAGLRCARADEIVQAGLIDVPMYEQLLSADVVIADISTSNANAFYELGVRHALRPYTTITIAEDKMVFPFDVSHLAIRKYQHLGDGIDYAEVQRMQDVLVSALRTIVDTPKSDSPVYTFFSDLSPPVRKALRDAVAQSAPSAVTPAAGAAVKPMQDSAKDLMRHAEEARERSDFVTAVAFLTALKKMAPTDPFVVQRLALATYKSKLPDPLQALRQAQAILRELDPNDSTDVETAGLWGAIHKRLWDLGKDRKDLDTALASYEKGFYLKNDYYNGINLAYLYNLRASISDGAEAVADFVIAKRIRRRVLDICEAWLSAEQARQERNKRLNQAPDWADREEKLRAEEHYWVLATKAEAWAGLAEAVKAQETLDGAKALLPAPAAYMVESSEAQIASLKKLMDTVKHE